MRLSANRRCAVEGCSGGSNCNCLGQRVPPLASNVPRLRRSNGTLVRRRDLHAGVNGHGPISTSKTRQLAGTGPFSGSTGSGSATARSSALFTTGGKGPVVPPIGRVVVTGEKEKRCGHDITAEFVKSLKAFMDECDAAKKEYAECINGFLAKLPGPGGEALCEAAKNAKKLNSIYSRTKPGGTLDYKPREKRKFDNRCPHSKGCSWTVTRCEMCVDADTPGNFALGFCSEYAGYGSLGNFISSYGDYSSSGSSSGSSSSPTDLEEEVADQDVITEGRNAAKEARADRERAGKGEEKGKAKGDPVKTAVCKALKAYVDKHPEEASRSCPVCPILG